MPLNRILFTDETVIWAERFPNKKKHTLWCRSAGDLDLKDFAEHNPLRPTTLMVWLAVNYDMGLLPPVIFFKEGQKFTCTSQTYRDYVLQPTVDYMIAEGYDPKTFVLQ